LRPCLRRFAPRFESIHADMAAELALASSGMTTPFPCAILLAYNICAGLTGLESSFPRVSPSAFLDACSLSDHLLLADNDIVEQAFKLCRHPRINKSRVGLFENAEKGQASLGRHDVLSLGNQETLFLQPANDLRSGCRRANALGASFRRSRRTSSSTKRQAFCIASIRVPSL
jgi:hypothetical protein